MHSSVPRSTLNPLSIPEATENAQKSHRKCTFQNYQIFLLRPTLIYCAKSPRLRPSLRPVLAKAHPGPGSSAPAGLPSPTTATSVIASASSVADVMGPPSPWVRATGCLPVSAGPGQLGDSHVTALEAEPRYQQTQE